MLPGWHSDPSCIFVPEYNSTFFCVTSTFLITPGLPIHASHDLRSWKIASHAINRPSQLPLYSSTYGASNGIYAATLRYHKGTFYLVTTFFSNGISTLLFNTTDPYSDSAWSSPANITTIGYDPDLFWDDDGQSYITATAMNTAKIDLVTGAVGKPTNIWNGTGGAYPEGPHMYKKDGFYYLMISEGGTELGHSVTIARSKDIYGPYESYAGNPILTNRNTAEYFQTVGHSDIFQDAEGAYWACALATRSGPAWKNYPMGRETVLTPVNWATGQWPIFEPVRGREMGWPRSITTKDIPQASGSFITDPDIVDFEPGTKLPTNFLHWRWPRNGSFEISPLGHPNTLKMTPTGQITAADASSAGADGITLVTRLQTHTTFTFAFDLLFQPKVLNEEAGIIVFLTQEQHLDLGLILLPSSMNGSEVSIRLRTAGTGNDNSTIPIEIIRPVPAAWLVAPITLQVEAVNDTHYAFSAASARDRAKRVTIGFAPATIVSGGTGRFIGESGRANVSCWLLISFHEL